jgi:hypothetical protein
VEEDRVMAADFQEGEVRVVAVEQVEGGSHEPEQRDKEAEKTPENGGVPASGRWGNSYHATFYR